MCSQGELLLDWVSPDLAFETPLKLDLADTLDRAVAQLMMKKRLSDEKQIWIEPTINGEPCAPGCDELPAAGVLQTLHLVDLVSYGDTEHQQIDAGTVRRCAHGAVETHHAQMRTRPACPREHPKNQTESVFNTRSRCLALVHYSTDNNFQARAHTPPAAPLDNLCRADANVQGEGGAALEALRLRVLKEPKLNVCNVRLSNKGTLPGGHVRLAFADVSGPSPIWTREGTKQAKAPKIDFDLVTLVDESVHSATARPPPSALPPKSVLAIHLKCLRILYWVFGGCTHDSFRWERARFF